MLMKYLLNFAFVGSTFLVLFSDEVKYFSVDGCINR